MLKIKLLPMAALLGLGLLPSAHAADQLQDNRWYVAPFASFLDTAGDRKAENGWGGGMGIGKILDQHFNVELRGFYQGFDNNKKSFNLAGGTADLQYYFFRDKFSPYAVVALGGMNTSYGSKSGAGFVGETGVGFSYEFTDNLLLRSDIRYRYNNNFDLSHSGRNEFNDMTINLGFVIPFGEKPKAMPVKVDVPAPVVPAPRPAAPADCSTKDSDADGVNDCLDKCPGTARGSKVDMNGCPLKLILKGSQFKVDSAVLRPEAKEILDEVAASVKAYPEKNEIDVNGYASSEGGVAHNLKLSDNRAKSVATYLKSKGVTNKLVTKGYGIANPVADNKTEAGRSENRRVELIWVQ